MAIYSFFMAVCLDLVRESRARYRRIPTIPVVVSGRGKAVAKKCGTSMTVASYLLIASDLPALEGPSLNVRDVFELMRKHSCWEFPPTGQQAKLKDGDLLLFYLGSKVRHLVGEATVAGASGPIKKESTFDRRRLPFFAWPTPLRDFKLYPSNRADFALIVRLSFASDSEVTRPYVGLLLRVGMRTLTAEDVKLIRQTAGVSLPAGLQV